jgi:hypothetical protein
MWNSEVQAAEVAQRRTAVSSKCFQLHYTCWQTLRRRASPLPFPSFFPLLLWRFPSSQLFCVHYNIPALMSFLPYSKLHAMVAVVTLAKDCMWCNHNNPTIKQSQTIAMHGWKSCMQLSNLNLNNFKMLEDMGLKILHRGPLEWHYLRTKFLENLPSGSKVITGRHTNRLVIWYAYFHFWKVG